MLKFFNIRTCTFSSYWMFLVFKTHNVRVFYVWTKTYIHGFVKGSRSTLKLEPLHKKNFPLSPKIYAHSGDCYIEVIMLYQRLYYHHTSSLLLDPRWLPEGSNKIESVHSFLPSILLSFCLYGCFFLELNH